MQYQPKFFNINEFKCPCCHQVTISEALVVTLDMIRAVWSAPIVVKSGFRCKKHNAEMGGMADSRHLIGCAVDIKPADKELMIAFKSLFSPFEKLTQSCLKQGLNWELRVNDDYVHLAVPIAERKSTWNGGIIDVRFI